jgi:hypothetical protein
MQRYSAHARAEWAEKLELGWRGPTKSACVTGPPDRLAFGTECVGSVTLGPGSAAVPSQHTRTRTQPRARARSHDIPPCCALCGVARRAGGRAAIVALLCAGFPLGALNTNVCPSGSSKIGTEAACSIAATALGMSYGYSRTDYPSGCAYSGRVDRVFFNADPTGAPRPDAQPLCAGAPTPHARFCAWVCASVRECARV